MIPAKQTWPEKTEADLPVTVETTESTEIVDPRLYGVVKLLILAFLYYVIVVM